MKPAYTATVGLLVSLLMAGCATPGSSEAQCTEDSGSVGFIIPTGFGVSIGESGLKAAFKTIRDYFSQRPAVSEADKAKAAELAADAAAKSAAPMNDEQKRALRAQAGEWVNTYTEKCKPRS